MTVEESKGSMGRACAPRDQFPVGMRVLAVDDDLTCLKLLEALLRRCQYHVTTTNQAIVALKLLRENKDGFDLVISDVHMPDMDGFKLLELVGLEMDLPVIMLSANGETSAVMKGITHGACDYLLKPVRIEELKNIWQHVVRRRKFENKDHSNFINGDDDEKPQANSNGGRGTFTNGSSGHSGKLNRKRKDQDEEEDDGSEENTNENDDPSAQKKPRVVWSIELHRKFVAAVNQLGIDKAVPKRILDLMNVEKLTRENVASHLQKYRLYLKRLNAVASQQANMVAALGGRDPSYLPTSSLDGYRSFNALVRSGQLPALHSFQPSGLLSRTSYPTGMGLHALPSPGTVQFTHTNSPISSPISDLSKFHHIISPGNHQGNLLQGLPAKLELDPLQQTRVQDANNCLPGGFSGDGLASRFSRNSIANAASSSMMLQSNQQQTQARVLGNYSSSDVPSLSSDPFKVTVGSSLQLPDLARCNATWQGAGSITKYSTNTLPIDVPLINSDLAPVKVLDSVASVISHVDNDCHDVSRNVVAAPLHDSVRGIDPKCQASPLGGNMMLVPMTVHIDEGSKSSNSRHTGNSKQKQEEHTKVDSNKPNLIYCSSTSPSYPNHPIGHLSENQRLPSGLCNIKAEINTIAQSNFGTSFYPQYCKIDKPTIDGQMKNEYNTVGSKLQGGLRSNGGSLDDLVNAMIKPERNDLIFVDGEAECDIFPLESIDGN